MSIVSPAPDSALARFQDLLGPGCLIAVEDARVRARALGRPVLAAYTAPVHMGAPVELFAAAHAVGAGELWYLERPDRGEAMVGVGAAASVAVDGRDAVRRAAAEWRALSAHAAERTDERIVGDTPALTAFAGFAFDPAQPRRDGQWGAFPGAVIGMPRLLVRWSAEGTVATVAALIGPDEDTQQPVAALVHLLANLEASSDSPAMFVDVPGVAPCGAEESGRRAFERLVAEARGQVRTGGLRKVVVARAADYAADKPIEPSAVLARLRREHPTATIFAVRRGDAVFIGATPERLARVADGRIETMALAGTAARGASAAEDAALADALMASAKNREEHAVVVEAIRDWLAPICADVRTEAAPRLRRLANVQHLETPITAALAPGRGLLDVAAVLHPTPAVCGLPREAALDFLREHEGLDRGWYAGALGCVDARGQGELVVALRSALLRGRAARVFAGCGIVADSDPAEEYEESRLKMRVMLRALGGEA